MSGKAANLNLLSGASVDAKCANAEVTQSGIPLDFCLTSFAVPVARLDVAKSIKSLALADVQMIPLQLPGTSGFFVVNVIRKVECLDGSRSLYTKWTSQDHRQDLAGQYRQVAKLVIDASLVPSDAHMFRIAGWVIGLIVSDELRRAMLDAGCFGALFEDLD